MKICKILPDCGDCIVPADYADYAMGGYDTCEYCVKDHREYEILGICAVGFFRKPMAFLVNPSSKDLMQVRADLIYDIKNVEENYFDKNEEE